jgi:hypothetical protein
MAASDQYVLCGLALLARLDYLVGQIEGANETIKPMRALTA